MDKIKNVFFKHKIWAKVTKFNRTHEQSSSSRMYFSKVWAKASYWILSNSLAYKYICKCNHQNQDCTFLLVTHQGFFSAEARNGGDAAIVGSRIELSWYLVNGISVYINIEQVREYTVPALEREKQRAFDPSVSLLANHARIYISLCKDLSTHLPLIDLFYLSLIWYIVYTILLY